MSQTDAFRDLLEMYNDTSERCLKYKEISAAKSELIRLLKIPRKSTFEILEYSNILDKITKLEEELTELIEKQLNKKVYDIGKSKKSRSKRTRNI